MRPKSRKDGNKTRGKNFKIQKISSYRKVKVVWTQKTMSSGSRTWKTGVKGSKQREDKGDHFISLWFGKMEKKVCYMLSGSWEAARKHFKRVFVKRADKKWSKGSSSLRQC